MPQRRPLTIRIDGIERPEVPCENELFTVMGVGGADEDCFHRTDAPFMLDIVADDDLHWTTTVLTTA